MITITPRTPLTARGIELVHVLQELFSGIDTTVLCVEDCRVLCELLFAESRVFAEKAFVLRSVPTSTSRIQDSDIDDCCDEEYREDEWSETKVH